MTLLTLRHVWKDYQLGEERVTALRDVTLSIHEGEFLTIIGKSGSGKSTLLHIIGLLDQPSRGEVLLQDVPTHALNDDQLSQYRGKTLGFVFQTFNLISTLTAWENVALPLRIQGVAEREIQTRVRDALDTVGMLHRAWHTPSRMSGGERQRIAIARAIVHEPRLIAADEPTGNLDSKNGYAIAKLFTRLHKEGRTIVLVTHDPDISLLGTRRITLQDGRIIREEQLTQKQREKALARLSGRS